MQQHVKLKALQSGIILVDVWIFFIAIAAALWWAFSNWETLPAWGQYLAIGAASLLGIFFVAGILYSTFYGDKRKGPRF